jgi:calcium/proton exchanger cax
LGGFQVSKVFVGVILLPIVGNATEHMTAVTMAIKNRMELAMGIAVGSATQVGTHTSGHTYFDCIILYILDW